MYNAPKDKTTGVPALFFIWLQVWTKPILVYLCITCLLFHCLKIVRFRQVYFKDLGVKRNPLADQDVANLIIG